MIMTTLFLLTAAKRATSRYFECDEEEDYSYSDNEDERLNYFNYDDEPYQYTCPQCPPPYQQYIQDCNECMYRCRECSPDYGPEGDSSIVCGSATESQAEGADDDDDDDDEEVKKESRVFITSPPVEPGADARSTELLLPSRPETPIHEQVNMIYLFIYVQPAKHMQLQGKHVNFMIN
ncbi:hypothetical protein JYU34_000925 [Plutella xylostella]|uniref:Uncharacterized protein n=1 Tax=Plutella xylostella TaxID=51655 RepID=A0ABQ7R5M3_PLUXY|nr:hypothetical protein JYU34_000925 [Plutella xylostella]